MFNELNLYRPKMIQYKVNQLGLNFQMFLIISLNELKAAVHGITRAPLSKNVVCLHINVNLLTVPPLDPTYVILILINNTNHCI